MYVENKVLIKAVEQINAGFERLDKEILELKDALKKSKQEINALQQTQENTEPPKKVTRSKSLRQRQGKSDPVRGAGSEDSG